MRGQPDERNGIIRSVATVILVIVIAVVVAVSTGVASPQGSQPPKAAPKAEVPKKAKPSGCPYARIGLSYYRTRYAYWQMARDVPVPTWRKPRNCADARYLARVWVKRAIQARKSYFQWKTQQRTLRNHNTWLEAVREAQKAYPGTDGWLISCSASEGAHGAWVPNREGSGVGGWMQMYPSTYRTMMHGYYLPAHGRWYEGAWKDLKRRGFIVAKAVDSWYSPLGQALASAYGKLNGRGGEWHGSGCHN